MLPESLYKALPFIYISLGTVCVLAVDSDIIFIPAFLLVAAGCMILWMRYQPRRDEKKIKARKKPKKSKLASELGYAYKARERDRRVPTGKQEFPLTDDHGNLIAFERRVGERRGKK